MEPEESKKFKIKTWETGGDKEKKGCCQNTVNLQCIGKEAESFRSFPKSRFLILNSADMFPPWELKTFI